MLQDSDRTVNFEDIELQEDMSYHEHPVAILEETERKTRNKSIKFLKVKWSHHSDREASIPNIRSFSSPRSRDEILS